MGLLELTAAIQAQLEEALTPEVDVIQVTAQMNFNPTPPTVDIYPADPFQEPDSFGPLHRQAIFTVRARVAILDTDYGQTLLLELMDPSSPKSVLNALAADATFDGACQDSTVDGPVTWGQYADPVGQNQDMLGCQWRLRTIL